MLLSVSLKEWYFLVLWYTFPLWCFQLAVKNAADLLIAKNPEYNQLKIQTVGKDEKHTGYMSTEWFFVCSGLWVNEAEAIEGP